MSFFVPPTSSSTSAAGGNGNIPLPTNAMLSQQDFLNLLVTQMTAQDPLKPTDSQDLLSQMTQFSTLNANNTLQTQLANMQLSQEYTAAGSLLGKQVTLQLDSKTTAQGTVTGIDASGSAPQIIVNGTSYTLDKVISITDPTTTTPTQ
jgi:flagellar basal-body rod modification protein FlgD